MQSAFIYGPGMIRTLMNLILVNIGINAVYYLSTVVLIPWLFLAMENKLGIDRHPTAWLRMGAVILGLAAITLQLWCIVLFQLHGQGTPSPARPTKQIVTSGPYAFARNPLNIGEVALFVALAAWFGSPALLFYALLAWCAFHLFIVKYEEPRNRAAFGEAYAHYYEKVPRWTPRMRK